VTTVAAVAIAAAALLFVLGRLQGARRRLRPEEETVMRGKRQRKLDKLREFDPPHEPKSIFDLMQEEAEELGLAQVPGGDELEMPVRLKVWKRDAEIREACRGSVRYMVAPGVAPSTATEDDVTLDCDDGPAGRAGDAEAAPPVPPGGVEPGS